MAQILSDKDILEKSKEIEDLLQTLNKEGSHLWKVKSTSKWFRRKYQLDLSDLSLHYEPTYNGNCLQKPTKKIKLCDIVDIRQGWKTDRFNKICSNEERKRQKNQSYKSKVEEQSCFSIITQKDTVDLIAPNKEIADRWVKALIHLLLLQKNIEQETRYESWLRSKFTKADLDKNKCLNFQETMRLLKELNIEKNENEALELFNEANTKRANRRNVREVLDEDEFIVFYFKLLKRPEIEDLFQKYAVNKVLSANGLQEFLQKEEQDFESITMEDCAKMITVYEQSELKKTNEMSVSGFVNMLLSQKFDIFNHKNLSVHQDMTKPLSHYFIASSHNTYLVGNQLSGASSVEAYIDALKRGCRCLEMDCWDGDGDEPVVYHGYTLTSKILFKEILSDAIKPYAFYTSRYPIILSLENHCTEKYQKKMAEHLRNILGDMLYLTDPTDDMEFLPSPEQLKDKILIKAKKKGSISGGGGKKLVHHKSQGSELNVNGSDAFLDSGLRDPPKASTESLDDSDADESEIEESIEFIDGVGKSPKKKVANDLSSLVNLIQAVHFTSFANSKEDGKCYQMSSFSEKRASRIIEEQGTDFVDYNKRQISRIYPAGSRTTSSNFNPIDYWNAGCQIVALNYQTEDYSNFYNFSLFSENGKSGYVLKPECLTSSESSFDPSKNIRKNKGVLMTLKIISGQHLPKAHGNSEVVDPYVDVRILGLDQDKSKFTTKVIRNNGFNPVWKDEVFKTNVKCPELAMLLFRVKDYSQTNTDVDLAYYALPFSAITTGYRHIHLLNLKGDPLVPASIFVHISLEKYSGSK